MRYLYLSILLSVIALGAYALETVYIASGTVLAIVQESGIGPYVLAGLTIGIFMALTSRASVGRFFRLYWRQVGSSARGFLVMFGFGLAIVLALSALLAVAGRAAWGSGATAVQANVLLVTTISAVFLACAVAISEELL